MSTEPFVVFVHPVDDWFEALAKPVEVEEGAPLFRGELSTFGFTFVSSPAPAVTRTMVNTRPTPWLVPVPFMRRLLAVCIAAMFDGWQR